MISVIKNIGIILKASEKDDYNSREKIAQDLPSNVCFSVLFSIVSFFSFSFFFFFFDAYLEIFTSRVSARIEKQTRLMAEADLSLRAML